MGVSSRLDLPRDGRPGRSPSAERSPFAAGRGFALPDAERAPEERERDERCRLGPSDSSDPSGRRSSSEPPLRRRRRRRFLPSPPDSPRGLESAWESPASGWGSDSSAWAGSRVAFESDLPREPRDRVPRLRRGVLDPLVGIAPNGSSSWELERGDSSGTKRVSGVIEGRCRGYPLPGMKMPKQRAKGAANPTWGATIKRGATSTGGTPRRVAGLR